MLFECIKNGTSPDRVVSFAKEYLLDRGFEEFFPNKLFHPIHGGKYLITPYPDVIFAFTVGAKSRQFQSMRMAFAHVDQPCFKIKGKADHVSMGCGQLNVGIYGGMKDHTWFDRPLGIAGMVALRGEDVFRPRMVSYDSGRPLAVIPGVAIHMKREMNDGWKIDRQKEMLPVVSLEKQWNQGSFLAFLGSELEVDPSEILSYDLNLYNRAEPEYVGLHKELIAAPRLDNLASVSLLLESLTQSDREDGINLIGLFNHEEVGSVSKSGADSTLLQMVLRQIFHALTCTDDMLRASLADSFYLSLDGAHAAHPNYPECADITTRAIMGRGGVIKSSASCKYASDSRMKAIMVGLAEKYDILLQEVADRNTIRGGYTIGPMVGAQLPMYGCDLGVPMWSMHSALETMAASDYDQLCQLVTAYFND